MIKCSITNIKTKIKSYNSIVTTNFNNVYNSYNDDKVLQEESKCILLSVIVIDSVFKSGEVCYPQAFLRM